jgi:hypothetical protein
LKIDLIGFVHILRAGQTHSGTFENPLSAVLLAKKQKRTQTSEEFRKNAAGEKNEENSRRSNTCERELLILMCTWKTHRLILIYMQAAIVQKI